MSVAILVSWALPVIVIAYMVLLSRFIGIMRRDYQEYWQSIGAPSLWEPNGQIAILKRVFLPKGLPAEIIARHGGRLNLIRAFAVLGLALFLVVLLMIWLGYFEPSS